MIQNRSDVLSDAKNPDVDEPIHARRHPWRNLGIVFILLILVTLAWSAATNPGFYWDIAAGYVLDPRVLRGVLLSIEVTVLCMGIGIALGTVLAVMKLSSHWFLVGASTVYIWVFRSIPQLVQLVLWYNLGALYSSITLGIPFTDAFVEFDTNSLITPFSAAMLGLGLSQAGYTAEVVRSGIMSVGAGQLDAARAVGMSAGQVFRRIVAPQALRVIIPPVGNEYISMLKNTSLLSVIALPELFYSVQLIYSRTYETIPLLMTACFWYLLLVSLFSIGQHFLERRFSRGYAR